jgi:phytoene dehydrogenase-like protein
MALPMHIHPRASARHKAMQQKKHARALKSKHAQQPRVRVYFPLHKHARVHKRHKAMQHKAHARTQKQARAATTRARVLSSTQTARVHSKVGTRNIRARAWRSLCTYTHARVRSTRPCNTKHTRAFKSKHAQQPSVRVYLPLHIRARVRYKAHVCTQK